MEAHKRMNFSMMTLMKGGPSFGRRPNVEDGVCCRPYFARYNLGPPPSVFRNVYDTQPREIPNNPVPVPDDW